MGEGASDPGIPPPLATCLGKVNLTRQANDMSLHASFFCSGRSIWKKLIFSIKQTSHFNEIQWPTIFTRHFTSACQFHSRALPFKLEKYCKCCDMNAVLLLVFKLGTVVPYFNDFFFHGSQIQMTIFRCRLTSADFFRILCNHFVIPLIIFLLYILIALFTDLDLETGRL